MTDDLSCATAHELLSAAADGETTAAERRRLDVHLAGCTACRRLHARIEFVDRQVRVRPAEPVPDLVASVMARVRPAVLGRGGWMRPALGWVAVVMLAQNAGALVLGRLEGAEPHLARHVGAFGVALAVGFAYVAWRPHRAFGMLPFVAALTATTFASAAFDVAENGRTALAEAAHITELAGLALLWMIAGSPGWHGWDDVHRRLLHPFRPGNPLRHGR